MRGLIMKRYMYDFREYTGETYTTGGIEIPLKHLKKVMFAVVEPVFPDTDDTVYKIETTYEDNKVKVVIKSIDVTGTSPVSWTELSNGADISGFKFKVFAFGY